MSIGKETRIRAAETGMRLNINAYNAAVHKNLHYFSPGCGRQKHSSNDGLHQGKLS